MTDADSPRRRSFVSDSRLARIRILVLLGKYRLSEHVRSDVENGEIDFDAIKHSIVNAVSILRQKDELETSVDRRKYVITGPDLAGLSFRTVGKIVAQPDGDEYFVITAFEVT